MPLVPCPLSIEPRRAGYLALMALVVTLLGAGCTDRLNKLVEIKEVPSSGTDVGVIRGVPPPIPDTLKGLK